MNNKRALKVLISFIIIIFNLCIISNASTTDWPKLDKLGEYYLINKLIYDRTPGIYCIQQDATLASNHTCLYKVKSSGTVEINNTSIDSTDIAFNMVMDLNKDKNGGTDSTVENEGQKAAGDKGIGTGKTNSNTGDYTTIKNIAESISKLNNLNENETVLGAKENSDGTYTSDTYNLLKNIKLKGVSDRYKNYEPSISEPTVQGAGSVSLEGATTILDGKEVKFKISDVKDDSVSIEYTITFNNFPTKVDYKTIGLVECPTPISLENGEHTSGSLTEESPRSKWGEFIWDISLEGLGVNNKTELLQKLTNPAIHNCYAHFVLAPKNYYKVINEQELMLIKIEDGKLEIKIKIKINLTPPTKIEVKKVWTVTSGSVPTEVYPDVEVELIEDGTKVVDSKILSKKRNELTATFENLKPGKTYTVKEKPGDSSISYGGKDYKIEYDTDAKSGSLISINNKITPPDTPPDEPDKPTPGDDENAKLKIEKEVVHVFSKYEGDTSKVGSNDVQNEKNANVQRGDEVVFKITITNESKNETYERDLAEKEKSDHKISYMLAKDKSTLKCPASYHHRRFWTDPNCNGHSVNYYSDFKVNCEDEYKLKEVTITDEVLEKNVEDLKIYKGEASDSSYSVKPDPSEREYTNSDTSTKGEWTGSGSDYTWTASENYELASGDSTVLYLIGKVNENWTDYGKEDTNRATIASSTFKKITHKTVTYKIHTVTYKHTYHRELVGFDAEGNPMYVYVLSDCSESEDTNPSDGSTKLDDEEKDVSGPSGDRDEAKVKLQGYDVDIKKELTTIVAQIKKANDVTDLSYVEWGDLVEYTITATNKGDTNIYEGIYVTDVLKKGLSYYKGGGDLKDYGKLNKESWYESGMAGWTTTTESAGGYYNEIKIDPNTVTGLNSGYPPKGTNGLAKDKKVNITIDAEVIGNPTTGSIINYVEALAVKNRNGIEIELSPKPNDEIETPIETYEIGVEKNVDSVISAGLKCDDPRNNAVAEKYKLDTKLAMTDRGDYVKFKIVVTNKHNETNLWKVELKDTFAPGLEYIKYESEKTWNVDDSNINSNELKLTYMSTGKNVESDEDWDKIAPNDQLVLYLYFQVVDGGEVSQNGKIYDNVVEITQVWNRNAKELEDDYITNNPKEDKASVKVRQITAVIDKAVTNVYGGIEETVYDEASETERLRNVDVSSVYSEKELYKTISPVEVERGDEITYTIKVRNTAIDDNSGGLISKMKIIDTYDTNLIFVDFKQTEGNGLTCKKISDGILEINYDWNNGTIPFMPEKELEFKITFVLNKTNDGDSVEKYGQKYENKVQINEIKNVNDWTWCLNGTTNEHHNDRNCEFATPGLLSSLANTGGIRADLASYDYVYMLQYAVELEKYVVNIQHTNDDGTVDNYNKDNGWAGNGDKTDRETWNGKNINEKTNKKETYPVQVEKGDIVTYEIKIKNTYNSYNDIDNIFYTKKEPSIYTIDILDIFSTEDYSKINETTKDVGLLYKDVSTINGRGKVEVVEEINASNRILRFTPRNQENQKATSKAVKGYGIKSSGEAAIRVSVEVTRSNMYLYEIINTAIIKEVYNRNNSIDEYIFKANNSEREKNKEIMPEILDKNNNIYNTYKVTEGNRLYLKYENSKKEIVNKIVLKDTDGKEYDTSRYIADADYINLKDLIISGYVWDDTDPNNEEDGLMTWGATNSTDAKVDGDVWAYLYRVEPNSVENYPEESTLVMKTKIDKNGYYIFGTPGDNTKVYSEDNGNRVTVNQKYRFEPINYKTPKIKVNGTETKDTQTKEIYENNFTNYRIVKAPNKDYNEGENQDGSTTRYDINKYHGYYQYYVEFEYNGMKYTHTVYGSDTTLEKNKVKGETENRKKTNSNQDGQYNLITNGRATRLSENWLPYRTSTKDNSEYYEIDSNAAEFKSVRESFNNQFETVAYNKGIDPNANDTPLSYTPETDNPHVSRYNYTDEVKIRARSFITEWIDKVGPEEKDTAKTYRYDSYKKFSATVGKFTNTLFFWDKHNTTRKYENIVGTTEETEYLKYINLGLKRRPIVDLELIKDVYNVQVDINGKTMVYEYNCVTPENLGRSDEDSTDAKYYTTGYKLYLYKSDYYYRYKNYSNEKVRTYKKGIEPENSELNPNVIDAGNERTWLTSLGFDLDEQKSESELNIQITYKYTITNKSGMPVNNRNELILGSINEIVDYHNADLIPNQTGRFVKQLKYPELENEKLNLVTEGTVYVATQYGAKKEEEKEKKKGLYKTINNIEGKTNDNFHTVYLSGFDSVKLYPEDSLDIYLTFTVSRTAFEFENTTENLKEAIKIGTKDNVAEISAFSTWYDSDSKYITNWSKNLETPGLIDKDSNPGDKDITSISDASNYGDDTYKVDIGLELYGDDTGNKNGERLIDGLVWEDVKVNDKGVYFKNNPAKIIYETMQVVSDGLYHNTRKQANSPDLDKDNDKTIDGMNVELIEIISDGDNVYEDRAEIYDENGNKISNLATETDDKGKYELKTYIPGNYVVRFKYGDNDATVNAGYNGQDYKSTTYQVNIGENSYYAQTYDGYNGEEYTYVGNLWHDLLSEDVNGTVGGKSYCDGKNNLGQKCSMNDENCTDHISDARDDEVRRLEVTAYSRTINNKNAEILNGQKNKDELIKQTNMFADTAKLQVEIEHLKYVKENNKQELETSKYDKGIIKQTEYYIENKLNIDEENVSIVEDKTLLKRDRKSNEIKIDGIMIPYYIGNIDFGLEARPTTNISLTKLVSGIRVETADGEEILDVEYEPQYSEDGTLLLNENGVPTVENSVTTGAEHMQALNSSTTDIWGNTTERNAENQNREKTNVVKQMYRNLKTTQGFYYINIDEDLMQGAVITLRYSIVVANESEVDTLGMLTGFKNGEQIYDEVLQILSNKESEYVKDKANNKLPVYNANDKKINKNENQGMKYGYYTGATYYNGKYHPETYVVETRIDQIIDYVDNNLNVREEDNSTKDSSWRTVSLKELVEGEIQKDIVGQNWTENADHKTLNNTYSKTLSVIKSNENEETLKYVAYGSNGIKTIEVNNVGNMLSDKVYRKVFEENVEDKDLENELKNASVTGSITVNKDNDKIKDSTGKSVTILDSNAREYITEQRNNILLSIPEADKNPDLYKYLIPAKALTAKPENEDLTININKDMIDQNKVSSQIRIAMEYLIDKYNDKNSKFSKNLEGLKNCLDVNVYSELPEEYDQQIYEIARGKILELAQNTIEDKLSKYVYGTQNGSRFLENDNKYEKINGETSAKIKITATRTISPESTAEEREDLTFENLAEILQFSNEAGRRDEFATVGDAQVWEGAWKASTGYTPQGGIPEDSIDGGEDGGNTETNESVTKTKTKERYDTDTTEMVLLSPPTGLSQRELVELGTVKTQNNILLISVLTLTMLGTIIVVIKISNRKKFYR